MPDRKTFDLRYVGRRFRDARMPVEVLSDLPAFRDLLVAFAKDQWRARHPGRARVPKGFDKSLSFDLIDIVEGSAVPKLAWAVQDDPQVKLPGFYDEIEDVVESAYEDVILLIEGGNPQPSDLNAEKIRALNRLGAGLRENESIQLPDRRIGGKVVSLDAYRRRQLIIGARETYQMRYEDVGILVGTFANPDYYDGTITLNTERYGNIVVPLDNDEIVQSYDGNLYQEVQFELLVELDRQDNVKRVASVFDIALVGDDSEGISSVNSARDRLEEISHLQDGWLDGEGSAIGSDALRAAQHFVETRIDLASSIKIFPEASGGVLFDFEWNGWDYSVLFKSSGDVDFYGIEIEGGGELPLTEFSSGDISLWSVIDEQVSRNG